MLNSLMSLQYLHARANHYFPSIWTPRTFAASWWWQGHGICLTLRSVLCGGSCAIISLHPSFSPYVHVWRRWLTEEAEAAALSNNNQLWDGQDGQFAQVLHAQANQGFCWDAELQTGLKRTLRFNQRITTSLPITITGDEQQLFSPWSLGHQTSSTNVHPHFDILKQLSGGSCCLEETNCFKTVASFVCQGLNIPIRESLHQLKTPTLLWAIVFTVEPFCPLGLTGKKS